MRFEIARRIERLEQTTGGMAGSDAELWVCQPEAEKAELSALMAIVGSPRDFTLLSNEQLRRVRNRPPTTP